MNRQTILAPFNPAGNSVQSLGPIINRALGHWELGITLNPVPDILLYHLTRLLPQRHGVVVTTIEPGSPAELAGMRRGDVILRYGQFTVDMPEQLIGMVQASGGSSVRLTVIQAGNLRTIDVAAAFCPGAMGGPPASALSISVQTGHGSVSLAGDNDRFKLSGEFIGDAGQRYHLEKAGSMAEILAEIEKLPPDLLRIVKSQLPTGTFAETH
jgi:membrane-associated protease RseP (regulator of RpoE activity)